MSLIHQWLADLALLPDINSLEKWQPFHYARHSRLVSAADLSSVLHELGAVTGWLTETSRVLSVQNECIVFEHLPLAGEFFNGENHWQLSHLSRGQWELTHYQLQPCSALEANCLGEPVTHLHHAQPSGRLSYWKLWEPDSQQAPHCRVALLKAIEGIRS